MQHIKINPNMPLRMLDYDLAIEALPVNSKVRDFLESYRRRLLREGATTVKELTDHGVPEKIALAFFDDTILPDEGKSDKNE